jgi:predicted ATPase
MRLSRLEIQNYKSLRDVAIEPGPLSVFVGPNGAGKSNLADAIDFLGDVYRWGLEQAVARKGGYENICFRQARRSKAPIRFRVVLEGPRRTFRKEGKRLISQTHHIVVAHAFEFRAEARGIQSPFAVSSEEVTASVRGGPSGALLHFGIQGRTLEFLGGADLSETSSYDVEILRLILEDHLQSPRSAETALSAILPLVPWMRDTNQVLGSAKVFQLTPQKCRESGVPTPNPELGRFGGNLPAVVEYLKRSHPDEYGSFLETAMLVVPSIEEITTGFTHTKTLGLFVKENNFDRPWPAEDLSDGTIQTLGLLAAIFDPRPGLVVIEEPENSVHPWAIRNLVQAARTAAEKKQIFFTTHSPILIDRLKPEELWVVQRPGAATEIDPVLKLDPSLANSWGQGKFTLSEYLDSGALPGAVPTLRS